MKEPGAQQQRPGAHENSARVLEILRAHGKHATSFQILEPGYTYWFDEESASPGAVVAYVRSGSFRVTAGVPIAAEAGLAGVTSRFLTASEEAGDRVLFFSADDEFLQVLRAAPGNRSFDAVPIGLQPEWDPSQYSTEGRNRRSLRAQIARASNKGVTVRRIHSHEVTDAHGGIRHQIEEVLRRWLDGRRMSVMHFLVDLSPFHAAEERRYYLAEHAGEAVGFLAAIPVYQRQGWFFEDIVRAPNAPNGTVELLVDRAMSDAAEAGESYVTLGLAPLAGISTEAGEHRRMRQVLHACYRHLGALYQFTGVHQFKQRFRPDCWRTQYLVQCPPGLGVRGFHAVLRAFAGRGLLAFGFDTLRRLLGRISTRVWVATFLMLAILLIPWTVLIASVDGVYWFGSRRVQLAWTVFDSLMVGALITLGGMVHRGHRLARPLSGLLALATGTDLVLTTVQWLQLHHDANRLFVLAGHLGPLLATCLLVAYAVRTVPHQSRARREP